MTKERIVISRSAKRVKDKTTLQRVIHTEQVVYKTKLPSGKYRSETKHEHDNSRK